MKDIGIVESSEVENTALMVKPRVQTAESAPKQKKPSSRPRCQGAKNDGTPCPAPAIVDDYCPFHHPDPEKQALARQ
jgi:hypothetical protein